MIPEEEYKERVKVLIPKLEKKMTADAPETEELFKLYNDRFLPRENGKHCAQCRSRVFKKMQNYYNSIKDESKQDPNSASHI